MAALVVVIGEIGGPVQPGGRAGGTVQVTNLLGVVERFSVHLVGAPATWGVVDPSTVDLFPGQAATLSVIFDPPLGTPAGAIDFAVVVTPSGDPTAAVAEEASVLVGGDARIAASIDPQASRGRRRGRHTLVVANQGNTEVVVEISGRDPEDEVEVACTPSSVTIPPASEAAVAVMATAVRAARRAERRLSFDVVVAPSGGDPLTVPAALKQLPGPPWRVLAIAAAVLLVAGGVLIARSTEKPGSGTIVLGSATGSGASTSTVLDGGDSSTSVDQQPTTSTSGPTTTGGSTTKGPQPPPPSTTTSTRPPVVDPTTTTTRPPPPPPPGAPGAVRSPRVLGAAIVGADGYAPARTTATLSWTDPAAGGAATAHQITATFVTRASVEQGSPVAVADARAVQVFEVGSATTQTVTIDWGGGGAGGMQSNGTWRFAVVARNAAGSGPSTIAATAAVPRLKGTTGYEVYRLGWSVGVLLDTVRVQPPSGVGDNAVWSQSSGPGTSVAFGTAVRFEVTDAPPCADPCPPATQPSNPTS